MVATVVFILLFVLLGLGVFFIAMSGGAKGARASLQAQGKGGRRAMSIVLSLLILGFAAIIPALVFAHNDNTQKYQAPGGVDLTATQEAGRQVFATNCASCHTLRAANAVGKVGPNLDDLQPPAALVVNAVTKGRALGNGRNAMPSGLVSGEQVQEVAAFVSTVAGR